MNYEIIFVVFILVSIALVVRSIRKLWKANNTEVEQPTRKPSVQDKKKAKRKAERKARRKTRKHKR